MRHEAFDQTSPGVPGSWRSLALSPVLSRFPALFLSPARFPSPARVLSPALSLALCALLSGPALPAAERAERFVVLGDRTGSNTPGVYESILREVNLLAPDFVVTVGDQIEGYTESPDPLAAMWREYTAITSGLRAPLYLCPGNHDITRDGMVEMWKSVTGRETCYSFDREGVHFTIFDTGRWESSREWWEKSGYRDWLTRDLEAHARDRMSVVIFHKPYWYDTVADGKPDPLHDLFVRTGVDYVFNGHYHVYGSAVYDGIRYTITGSSGGGIDNENVGGGLFFQYLFCRIEGDSLAWGVMRRGSVLPRDTVTVADLKLGEKIERESIVLSPVRLEEGPGPHQARCTLTLQNATDQPFDSRSHWETPPNWEVLPGEAVTTLAPFSNQQVSFEVRRQGGIFPLPVLRLDYPYGSGKVYKYRGLLPGRRTQSIPRLQKGPHIDGTIEDGVWGPAGRMTEFASFDGDSCICDPTEILLAYDEQNLYLAARSTIAGGREPVARARERDGLVGRDDCISIFLSPDRAETTMVQISVNVAGVVSDQRLTVRPSGGTGGEGVKWNADFRSATKRAPDAWTLEAAIPFRTLGASPPKPGTEWRANFRRRQVALNSTADWQVPVGYEPARFGILRFE